MAATGIFVFDAVAIATVEINVLTKSLMGKAAFVNTKTGATHGWTEGSGHIWSEETKAAVTALVASMERDIARVHMGQETNYKANQIVPVVSGLGEHLTDGDGTRSI